MHKAAKDAIHDLVLNLRKTLEGEVERELGRFGIYTERDWIAASDLPRLSKKEKEYDRPRVEAAIQREEDAGLDQTEAVRAFIRETAYTHMNRLLGLKCMEVRGLITEAVTTRPIYSDRSQRHRDYLDEHPRAHRETDRGLVAMLQEAYNEVSQQIGVVFDPDSDYSLVWPRHTVLKECIDWVNVLDEQVARKVDSDPQVMTSVYADDTFLGWVYQYFQEEEKARVFGQARAQKISGYDIIPATTAYTERYMVQFLVENSLGALWMEMYPDSEVCDQWVYFVEDPNLQNEDGTRRQAREPRPVAGLTLLDPACGSAHFLLYAFDLFAQMYEAEAEMQGQPVDRIEVARRILRDNLHGIDIDLRSVQLSALNLYMKACTYARVRLDELQQNGSVRMNLVCADIVLRGGSEFKELLDRFRGDPLTQELMRTIWRGLENARELGSLLRIEEKVDRLVRRKRTQERGGFWERGDDLWDLWKQDLLTAMQEVVAKATEAFDVNQRMFRQEALKGVQLLDLLTHRYDVITTNPPYMAHTYMGQRLKDFIKSEYPLGKVDIYAAFIVRCIGISNSLGKVGMITQQSFMFLPSFARLRDHLLSMASIRTLAHLGSGSFEDISGHVVSSALFVLNKPMTASTKGVYFNLLDSGIKAEALCEAIRFTRSDDVDGSPVVFVVGQEMFGTIDGQPIQYWTDPKLFEIMERFPPLDSVCDCKTGMRLSQRHRFLRYNWEVPESHKGTRWLPYVHGGEMRKFYGNLEYFIDWGDEATAEYDRLKYHRNQAFYLREGLNFTNISGKEFSIRYYPAGNVFDVGGPAVFPQNADLYYILGFMNSKLVSVILNKLNSTFHYYVSDVARIPYKEPDTKTRQIVSSTARRCTSMQQKLCTHSLTERDFEEPLLAWVCATIRDATSIETCYEASIYQKEQWLAEVLVGLGLIEDEILTLYDFGIQDRQSVFQEQGPPQAHYPILADHETTPHDCLPEIQAYLGTLRRISPQEWAASYSNSRPDIPDLPPREFLESELMRLYVDEGCSIGDVSATLELNPITIVALRRELGMTNSADLKREVENLLTHRIWELGKRDEDGIIPYDDGLQNPSLLEQVREEIEAVFGAERAIAIEAEMDEILGRGGLVQWLGDPFFRKHKSQFKSRPILWQITSPDKHFRILVYYHKLDRDTLRKVRSPGYLGGLLEQARTQLRAAKGQDLPDLKVIGDLEAYVADLEECDRQLESVIQGTVDVDLPDWAVGPYRGGKAPYDPDLDDGVKVNLLPLQAAGLLPISRVV